MIRGDWITAAFMPNMIDSLKNGLMPAELLDELGPFSLVAHEEHVAFLDRPGTYEVFGNRFAAAPGLYHPHPWSSSVFILRTLLREQPTLGRLLEIGCGTGAVGLSLLAHGLADALVLSDLAPEAVRVAQHNAEQLGLAGRVAVRQGSLFEPVPGERFDSLIFNLPLMHAAHPGGTHPALDDTAGRLAQDFFAQAAAYLSPGGKAYFTYSNISSPGLLQSFADTVELELLAAEWVVKSGFWLLLYRFGPPAS